VISRAWGKAWRESGERRRRGEAFLVFNHELQVWVKDRKKK
jgi:hypothetical protein